MIKFNLAVLLAERGVKITKVSNDTGISRTTLTSIYYNYAKGVQVETINTLCMYLKVSPSDLITFLPYDFSIKVDELTSRTEYAEVALHIKTLNNEYDCRLSLALKITVECYENFESVFEVQMRAGLIDNPDDDPEIDRNNSLIEKVFHSLPVQFVDDISSEIGNQVRNKLMMSNDCVSDFWWDDSLDTKI